MQLSNPQAFVDGSAKRRRRTTRCLLAVNIALALLLAAIAWIALSRSHKDFELQARSLAEGLAAVAQLNVQSEVDRVDGVIRATASELERLLASTGPVPDAVVNEVLRSRYELLNGIEAFRLTDRDGDVRWGTRLPDGAPVNVADRDYFEEARASVDARTIIGGPLTSRVSGNWVVAFMRPLRVDGRFAGVLYVSMNAAHFRRLFEQYELEPLDSIALRTLDFRLVARHSPGSSTQGQPGDDTVSPQLRDALAREPRAGHFVSRVQLDGQERTTAYRALQKWPFVVLAGVNQHRVFEPWRQQAMVIGTLVLLTCLLASAATWLLLRAQRREDGVLRALADEGKRIQALLRTAGDGIHITDRSGRLIDMSDSFAEMLKSSREQLLGRHISDWDVNQNRHVVDAWLARLKPGHRQRVDVQHRREDGRIIDVELQLNVAEIGGELVIFSSSRDVTDQRRLMKEQSAMLDSDLVGMARVKDRVITWRNRAVERLLGYGPGELEGQPVQIVYWDESSYRQVGIEGYEALKNQGYYRSQLRMRSKAGELVWVDFGAAPLSDTEIFVMLVDITEMKQAHESMAHAAFHDALTGLPNRLLLGDRISHAQASARREGRRVVVCYLDLDGFKPINDEYGHDAGDQLLSSVARRLLESIRPCDTAARMGGDEFVLVLADIQGEEWRPILDRVIANLRAPMALRSGARVSVGVTAGVAVDDEGDRSSAFDLIERADHLMLRGKRGGKGQVLRS